MQWARGISSHSGPLQVVRAAMIMPPPFAVSPDTLKQLSVPLLEKGLGTVETLVANHHRNRQRIRSLEAAMARASASREQLQSEVKTLQLQAAERRRQVTELQQQVVGREKQVTELQQQADSQSYAWKATLRWELAEAERRKNDELAGVNDELAAVNDELAAALRREAALSGDNQQLAAANERLLAQFEQANKLASERGEELARRPELDVKILRRCLTAVSAGAIDRRVRRTARQLLSAL